MEDLYIVTIKYKVTEKASISVIKFSGTDAVQVNKKKERIKAELYANHYEIVDINMYCEVI